MGNSNTHRDVVFLYKSRVCVVTKVSTDFIHVAHDYRNLELKCIWGENKVVWYETQLLCLLN